MTETAAFVDPTRRQFLCILHFAQIPLFFLVILTKRAVYKTASVYRNFINSGNLSKNKNDFRQYGEKSFPLSTRWCHRATIRTKHILMLGPDRIAVYLSTACYPVASDFLSSVFQNILEFSMLLPFSLRQKQGNFRE